MKPSIYWQWRNRRSRWPEMTEAELRTVIRSAAARERNKAQSSRSRHRDTRLAAVAVYINRFGKSEFLSQFSSRKLPAIHRMWLPGGYGWFKERSNNNLKGDAAKPRTLG